MVYVLLKVAAVGPAGALRLHIASACFPLELCVEFLFLLILLMVKIVDKKQLVDGLDLLGKPVLPLVSMVQFFFLTGEFVTVEEVIAQMPEPIETGYALYEHPRADLEAVIELLRPLEDVKNGKEPDFIVVAENGDPVDNMTAASAMAAQNILTAELETINSALCGPCGCTLCCVGPEKGMDQMFFEIPLAENEVDLFAVSRFDSDGSRCHRAMDDPPLETGGVPFYAGSETSLIHWQTGWSLILPKNSNCPNLAAKGQCLVYPERPDVCRRPQVFPYMLEPLDLSGESLPTYRLRGTLLAIVDCPYVKLLKDEIAAYGAACELEVLFKHNKA